MIPGEILLFIVLSSVVYVTVLSVAHSPNATSLPIQSILHTLTYPSYPTLTTSLSSLEYLRSNLLPSPTDDAILDVFDPQIASRLPTYMPTQPIKLPDQEEVWQRLKMLLETWSEACELAASEKLWSVKVSFKISYILWVLRTILMASSRFSQVCEFTKQTLIAVLHLHVLYQW